MNVLLRANLSKLFFLHLEKEEAAVAVRDHHKQASVLKVDEHCLLDRANAVLWGLFQNRRRILLQTLGLQDDDHLTGLLGHAALAAADGDQLFVFAERDVVDEDRVALGYQALAELSRLQRVYLKDALAVDAIDALVHDHELADVSVHELDLLRLEGRRRQVDLHDSS